MAMGFITLENAAVLLFFIGYYGMISDKSIIKAIISIGIMETAVILFFLGVGYARGDIPPIGAELSAAADPLPQAVVITAIVIGVAVTAINTVMFISLHRRHNIAHWGAHKPRA